MERLTRSLLFSFALLLFGLPAFAQGLLNTGGGDDPADPTIIEFEKAEYDLGTYKAGESVKIVVPFKNAGDADLIIDNVKPSCACTVLEWTTTPLKPGGKGEIRAEIDTADMEGEKEKSFAVLYNGNPPVERVNIKFKVVPADGAVEQGDADGDGIK
jgi:hypothetical protein